MSAWGQKQTFRDVRAMSALPPKADMCDALAHVCFGPIVDIAPRLRCGFRLVGLDKVLRISVKVRPKAFPA
jgi:hypothetical protein